MFGSRMMAEKIAFVLRKAAKPLVFGMVHVRALPGTPRYGEAGNSLATAISKACEEATVYMEEGLHGVLVENMHDIPYVKSAQSGPEIVACMTKVCSEIGSVAKKYDQKQKQHDGNGQRMLLGLQVLAACNQQAIAVAQACDFDFIRAEGFVFGHVADEGYIDGCAGPLLRYRKGIGAENVAIFADIKKKHSAHVITADVSLLETAKAAQFFCADGVILTGAATGEPADCQHLKDLKAGISSGLPVLIGSGITESNCPQFLTANAWIVGSHFKKNGDWSADIDRDVVKRFMETWRAI